MYNNPQATADWLQKEFFNQMLVALTDLNKPIKAQELGLLLEHSKKMATTCVDVVRKDLYVANQETALKFWNEVHKLIV
jgi:hypothetical protein